MLSWRVMRGKGCVDGAGIHKTMGAPDLHVDRGKAAGSWIKGQSSEPSWFPDFLKNREAAAQARDWC